MILKSLKDDFWGTWHRWQNQRPLWLLLSGGALFLEIFSWAFFQTFLGLLPCEMCVLIRFSMVGIFMGGLIGALNPRNVWLKILGFGTMLWWVGQGLIWDIKLEIENIRSADPTYFSLCQPSSASFPFGLPLDQWLPAHFLPQTTCGSKENAWSLLGLNMSEWLFFVYGAYIIIIALMLISWFLRRSSGKRPHPGL